VILTVRLIAAAPSSRLACENILHYFFHRRVKAALRKHAIVFTIEQFCGTVVGHPVPHEKKRTDPKTVVFCTLPYLRCRPWGNVFVAFGYSALSTAH
jgi:hypothetical protein